jgi:hypothetical protein
LPGNALIESESLFQSCALLEGFAGTVLIGPETGIAYESLQILKLTLASVGVKGTSAGLPLVSSTCQTLQSILPA